MKQIYSIIKRLVAIANVAMAHRTISPGISIHQLSFAVVKNRSQK